MGIFIDWQTTLECVICALVFASLLTLILFRQLGILQSFGYENKKLFKWAKRKSNMVIERFSLLAFSCLLTYAVISLCFSFTKEWACVIGLSAYLIFFLFYLYVEARADFKGGAVLTPRFKRLVITVWLVLAILVYIMVTLLNFADETWHNTLFSTLKYCALAIFPLTALYLAAFANSITSLWEKPINRSFIKKAKEKISAADITVVGITGSFGKTGVKNILAAMLEKKYKVLSTPLSYNTPLGISKTVNANELPSGGIFIAEMGARYEGDIAELCNICPPDWSVITGICPQHLESFKSLEAIVKTKGEIISATKNDCFVAADAFEYFKDASPKVKVCSCLEDVAADCTGTAFTLSLGGEKKRVKTRLLGAHNAANIALCAQLAFNLGVSLEDICGVAEGLDFTEHRLQLTENNGVYILDDGYNSNVVGARAAIGVLHSFGGRKICVTPGLVELGILEESENEALGRELAGLDLLILVGETLVGIVKKGYLEAGGDPEKLIEVSTLKRAQNELARFISKGDCVLFLNDLPEKYN